MKVLKLVIGLIFLSGSLFAQHPSDTISVQKRMGTVFVKNGQYLKPSQLVMAVQANPSALELMKKAKTNYDVGTVFGSVGGFLVGWPLGTAMGGGKPNWALAGVGAGLIGVSIPFGSAYVRHAKHAVELYNQGIKPPVEDKLEMKIKIDGNGVGFALKF